MNKTKIDWATMSWNPVTGCRHGCPYCYARRTATRFNAGLEDPAPLAGGLHVLPEKIKATPYPYGFEPKVTERSGGKEVQKWVLKSSHADNHYLDCEVYAAAAADVMGVRSLYLKSVEGQAAAPEPRKPAKQEPRQSQEENWINQNDTWI